MYNNAFFAIILTVQFLATYYMIANWDFFMSIPKVKVNMISKTLPISYTHDAFFDYVKLDKLWEDFVTLATVDSYLASKQNTLKYYIYFLIAVNNFYCNDVKYFP